jgi:hypothetical protein
MELKWVMELATRLQQLKAQEKEEDVPAHDRRSWSSLLLKKLRT